MAEERKRRVVKGHRVDVAKLVEKAIEAGGDDAAILAWLSNKLRLDLSDQVGRIDFSDPATATDQVNTYLDQRNETVRYGWNVRAR